MATELFANVPDTTVTSGGTDAPAGGTVESWTVASSASFPAASSGAGTQFHVGDPGAPTEMILVSNVSGTTWTVTRGAESTTPVAHAANFTVVQVVTAGFLGSILANPATTLGDMLYEDATPALARLAGSTSSTRKFLRQTGTGSSSAAPAWGTITAADVPVLNQNTTGTAGALSATLVIADGGTGETTASTAYSALSPMTTLGDMEYEDNTPQAVRLPGNTSLQDMVLTQAGNGTISAAPAWSVLPGQILVSSVYAPGTQNVLNVTSGTFTAFSSALVNSGTFTSPASGNVRVSVNVVSSGVAGGFGFALAAHGSVSPLAAPAVGVADSSATQQRLYPLAFEVTGLTPGSSYCYDLLGATPSGTVAVWANAGTSTVPAFNLSANRGAPVTFTVQAL